MQDKEQDDEVIQTIASSKSDQYKSARAWEVAQLIGGSALVFWGLFYLSTPQTAESAVTGPLTAPVSNILPRQAADSVGSSMGPLTQMDRSTGISWSTPALTRRTTRVSVPVKGRSSRSQISQESISQNSRPQVASAIAPVASPRVVHSADVKFKLFSKPKSVPAANPDPLALHPGDPAVLFLEVAMPQVVETFSDRLVRYLEVLERQEVSRHYSEKELQAQITHYLEREASGHLNNVMAHIHSDGILLSCQVKMGDLHLPVMTKLGVEVVRDRAHLIIQELKIGQYTATSDVREKLQIGINRTIDKHQSPLKIKRFWMTQGLIFLSVEVS